MWVDVSYGKNGDLAWTCTNSTASYAQSQAGRSKMAKYEFLVEDKKGLNDLVIEVTLSLDHDSAIFDGAAK